MAGVNTILVTDSNFKETVGGKLALIDFWAPWCGPCRVVGPVVDQLANEYAGQVAIGKLNVDDHGPLAAQYGVMSIPTLILFSEGKELERVVGAQPKEALAQILDRHLHA